MAFDTNDLSYHGLPDPLNFPEGHARRSIILGEMSSELPEPVSSFSLESGNKGVKFSKAIFS